MGGMFKHLFGVSKIPLEDRVNHIEQMTQNGNNILLHEIKNLEWLLLTLQNSVNVLTEKIGESPTIDGFAIPASKDWEVAKKEVLSGIHLPDTPQTQRVFNDRSGMYKENRDRDVWLGITASGRINLTFRNDLAFLITHAGMIRIKIIGERLYFQECKKSEEGQHISIKSRGANPHIQSAIFMWRSPGDIEPFAGGHDLKFDSEQRLYYIERGA